MSELPARPNLDQLRLQAKELLQAVRAGDPAAAARLRAVSDHPTLTAAQLAVAREYGFGSWARLKAEVQDRTTDLAQKVDAFLEASIRDWTGRALRLLADTPAIAHYDLRTALVLGDAGRVRAQIEGNTTLVTRSDPRTGWTPLHAVGASRWHRLDPERAPGLLVVARLLLAAGADPNDRTPERSGGWTPLRCAVAGAANPPITALLLEHGAVPEDHDLYLACFGDDDLQCLRLLLERAPDLAASTSLAAPIGGGGGTEAARLLLEAGVDPRRPIPVELFGSQHADEQDWPPVYAAVRVDSPADLVALLLEHGGDPSAPGPDARTPYQLATAQGRDDLVTLLRTHGAHDDAGAGDRFLAACLRTDLAAARDQLTRHPGLLDQLSDTQRGAIVDAAETGATTAVQVMLDLGFPIEARRDDDGASALHAACYAGSADTVRLLLANGADIEARDTSWNSTPIDWAMVGSGENPTRADNPDWVATVQTLIDAGANTDELTFSAHDPKPPSPQVAALLRSHGVGDH